jgi:hypothetical protein
MMEAMTPIKIIHPKTGILYSIALDKPTGLVTIRNMNTGMYRIRTLEEILDTIS